MVDLYFWQSQALTGSRIKYSTNSDLIYERTFETNAMNTTKLARKIQHVSNKWVWGLGSGLGLGYLCAPHPASLAVARKPHGKRHRRWNAPAGLLQFCDEASSGVPGSSQLIPMQGSWKTLAAATMWLFIMWPASNFSIWLRLCFLLWEHIVFSVLAPYCIFVRLFHQLPCTQSRLLTWIRHGMGISGNA